MTSITSFAKVVGAILTVSAMAIVGVNVRAQQPAGSFSSPNRYGPTDGETLYKTSCQACHMPAGEGAVGAGMYPALASNAKLRTARYPAGVVVRGLRGMPPFAGMMDDAQIAAVVNYVRTHFGNSYTDALSAADIKALRQ